MSILQAILATKRTELPDLRRRRLPAPPPSRPWSLRRGPGQPLRLIAEIKRRSPSAGPLSTRLSVEERALAYAAGGANMVSVLCDETYFDGSFEHLARVRAACDLPLLCKEFVLDECQLDAARAHGADAVLLIVRCLEPAALARLIAACGERSLVPLVEVHAPSEVAIALDAGATLIGVNSRNLDTLAVHPEQATSVLASLDSRGIRLHLSGIHTPEQVRQIAETTTDAVLVGESLMRRDDPLPLLRDLARAAGE
jgi:indole-3-glycerol phosphate synthase